MERVPYSPGPNADDFVDETGDDSYPSDRELDFSDTLGSLFDDEVNELDETFEEDPA